MILLNPGLRSHNDFIKLNERIVSSLKEMSKKDSEYFFSRSGLKFEDDVFRIACELSRGTIFERKIEKISGLKFPDLVIKIKETGGFGIEVKSTTQNHWKTTGSSIFEGTRIDGIDRISLVFGKFGEPVDFKWGIYEECLYDVAVTHSPRYLIDMNTKTTIFEKVGVPYDDLRKQENPFRIIKKYYRENILKSNQDIWWVDETSNNAKSLVIKDYSDLSKAEKCEIVSQCYVLFPNIFNKDKNIKYKKIGPWLISWHGVTNKSTRDMFTSGGKMDLSIKGTIYRNQPKIFYNLQKHLPRCLSFLNDVDESDLKFYWGVSIQADRIAQWIRLIEIQLTDEERSFPIKEMVFEKADER